MLKVGDIVINTLPVRSNPVVCESRGWDPIPKGQTGVVLAVHDSGMNKRLYKGAHGCVYVDVLMFNDGSGSSWRAGNYHAGTFLKII